MEELQKNINAENTKYKKAMNKLARLYLDSETPKQEEIKSVVKEMRQHYKKWKELKKE